MGFGFRQCDGDHVVESPHVGDVIVIRFVECVAGDESGDDGASFEGPVDESDGGFREIEGEDEIGGGVHGALFFEIIDSRLLKVVFFESVTGDEILAVG